MTTKSQSRAERFRHMPQEDMSCPCGDEPKEIQTANGSWKFRCSCGRQTQTFVRKYDARRMWPDVAKEPAP